MWEPAVVSSSKFNNKGADLYQKLHKILSIFAINPGTNIIIGKSILF